MSSPIRVDIDLSLHIRKICRNDDTSKLIFEHKNEWRHAFRVFVERNWKITLEKWMSRTGENQPVIAIDQPVMNFILDGRSSGNHRWHGQDLSEFIEIRPRFHRSTDNFMTTTSPLEWIINEIDVFVEEVDLRVFTVKAFDSQLEDVFEGSLMRDRDELSIATSCMVLSCLLQYTPELFGITSPHCFTVLRRYIIPYILSTMYHGQANELKNAQDAQESFETISSFVDFDRGKLENCLEEWLSVEGLKREDSIGLNRGFFHRDGRSTGLILTGGKGVGKTMFCRALMKYLAEIAPWAVTLLYRKQDTGTFYDGTYFLDEVSTSSDNHLLQHHPLALGMQYASEASPRGLRRIIKLFRDFKDASEPGKIMITLIDNIDSLTRSLQAHSVFTQLRAEAENAGFEFFILGTASSAALPTFDSVESTKNQFRVNNFRTMKIYSTPLKQCFDFILKYVENTPRLAFPEKVLDELRKCGKSALNNRSDSRWLSLESRMHNFLISDLRKISLHICIDLASRIMQQQHIGSEIQLSQSFRQDLLTQSVEKVLNYVPTLTGLSPNAVITLPWIRHDLNSFVGVERIAEDLHKQCSDNQQYIHFIRVVTSDEYDEFSRNINKQKYDHFVIPQRSIHSLLHHLHKRFMFRQSYLLESPEQMLPFHPKLSAHIPRFNLNAIDCFYWQNRGSLLVLNTLESLVGYHEEIERKVVSVNEKERILQKTVSDECEFGRSFEIGAAADIAFSNTLGNSTSGTEAVTVGKKTGASGDANAGLGVFRLVNPEGKGSAKKAWDSARKIENVSSRNLSHNRNIAPGLLFNTAIASSSTSKSGEALNRFDLSMEKKGSNTSRVFEIPEARTKLTIGLKTFCDTNGRYVENLKNLVLIFYRYEGCFEEIAIKRLGWNQNGKYSPPRIGCKHYQRLLKVRAPCCGEWTNCELCHDQTTDHKMDNKSVTELLCLVCHTTQALKTELQTSAARCENPSCGVQFSVFCCSICRIWKGKSLDGGVRHCYSCSECYPEKYYDLHQQICGFKS